MQFLQASYDYGLFGFMHFWSVVINCLPVTGFKTKFNHNLSIENAGLGSFEKLLISIDCYDQTSYGKFIGQ